MYMDFYMKAYIIIHIFSVSWPLLHYGAYPLSSVYGVIIIYLLPNIWICEKIQKTLCV